MHSDLSSTILSMYLSNRRSGYSALEALRDCYNGIMLILSRDSGENRLPIDAIPSCIFQTVSTMITDCVVFERNASANGKQDKASGRGGEGTR